MKKSQYQNKLLFFISMISLLISPIVEAHINLTYKYEAKETNNLLIEALGFTDGNNGKLAIDLGAGAGNEVHKLLQEFYSVLAIDSSNKATTMLNQRFASAVQKKQLEISNIKLEDIHSLAKADIILAINSIPFMDKKLFPKLWDQINHSLPKGGVFLGTFFGTKHHLKRGKTSPIIFRLHDKQIKKLLKNFEIVYFIEEIKKNIPATQEWKSNQYEHRFYVIAVKKTDD